VGRKKKDKRKKKSRAGEDTKTSPENTAAAPGRPDRAGEDGPGLGHLSGDWRKFYRLVINRVS
jgi:hypothetical protein